MNKVIMGLLALSLFQLGCASSGGKLGSVKSKKNALKSKDVETLTLRTERKNFGVCPRGTNSWKRNSLKKLIKSANACTKEKNWGQTQSIGDYLAVNHPDLPWGVYYLSLSAKGYEQYDKALWMIELAVKKAPELGFLHYEKGRILWKMGDGLRSLESMETALKHNSKLTEAHLFLGQINQRDGNFRAAKSHYEELLVLEPNNLVALVGLSDIYYAKRDWDEATSYLSRAVDVSPSRLPIKVRLAELYEIQENYELALSTYRRIQSLSRSNRSFKLPFDIKSKINSLKPIVAKRREANKISQAAEGDE